MVKSIGDLCESSPKWELYIANDSTNFAYGLSRRIYIGTGGNLALVDADGTAVIWPNLPSGIQLDVVAKRINNSSTTASGFIVQY